MKKEPTAYCTYTLMDIEIEDNQIKRNTTERLIILTFVMTSSTIFFGIWHFWWGFQFALARIRTRFCKDFGLGFQKWFSPLDDRGTLYILSPGFCFGFPLTPSPPTNCTHLLTRNLPAVKIYNRVSCQAGIVVSGSVMTSRALPHTILSRRPLTAPTKPLSVNLEPIFW